MAGEGARTCDADLDEFHRGCHKNKIRSGAAVAVCERNLAGVMHLGHAMEGSAARATISLHARQKKAAETGECSAKKKE